MKTNKILTFAITLIFACVSVLACFPSVIAGASTISLSESDYLNAAKVLKLICPDMPLGEGEVTTRAEFVSSVTMLLNIPLTEVTDTGFSDVSPEDKYATHIKYAAYLGLISNVDLFYPDSPITYAQAIKIVMTAAGFGRKAEFMGGFPTGYLMMANDADVGGYLNLGTDDKLSHADALSLIFDAAVTDMMDVSSYGSSYEYSTVEGKNILSAYHHIFMAEGIVDANENTGLFGMSATAGDDSIKIGTKIYRGYGYQNLIGKKSRVFFDSENRNNIIYAYELDNNIKEYTEKDRLTVSGSSITIEPHDSDKNERVNLDMNCPLIYNGKFYGGANYNTVINPTAGIVNLVDNDDDRTIDVIIVKDFRYGIVNSVNEFEERIYDKYAKNSMIDLGDASVKYLITQKDGTPMSIDELEPGNIIGYAVSADSKFYEIVRYDQKVGGTYESLTSGNKLVIKGEEYTLSDYYVNNIKPLSDIKIGTDIIAYLGIGNQVVYVEEFSTDIKYGILVAVGQTSGLSGKHMVKLYSQDGEMLELSLAKKVKDNSGSYQTAATVYASLPALTSGGTAGDVTRRVVKFTLNADGEINKLFTTVINTSQSTASLFKENVAESAPVLYYENGGRKPNLTQDNPSTPADDRLLHQGYNMKPFYKNGTLYPLFSLSSSCVIMKAPLQDKDITNDKYYGLSTITELNQGEESINAFGYDVDKNGAAFFLVAQDSGEASFARESEPVSAIVESVTLGVNEEGEEAAIAKIYSNGEWDKYYSTQDTKAAVLALKPGDIIAFIANSFNEITVVEPHFSYADNKTFKRRLDSSGTDTNQVGTRYPHTDAAGTILETGGNRVGYIGGYVYSFSGGKANVIRGDKDSGYNSNNELMTGNEQYKDINNVVNAASFAIGEVYPLSLSISRTVFVKFINDRSTGKTVSAQVYKEADLSSLETVFNAGTDADYVVSRSRYNAISLNIVYVNEYVN